MLNTLLRSLVMTVLVLWLGCAVNAQDRGVVTGTVVDSLGSPLPGVTVQLVGPETRRATTDARGMFTFDLLRAGSYQLRFERPGLLPVTQSVTVQAGNTTKLSIRMSVDANVKLPESRPREVRQDAAARGALLATAPAAAAAPMIAAPFDRYVGPFNTEAYDHLDENPFRRVSIDPLSTFSIDVDTASYANVRRFLNEGTLPPPGAVRIEELINYFRFSYPQPSSNQPFSVTTELAECPWNPQHRLALIGLQGRELPEKELPARNLVFLIDVSGSMMSADKLPLVRNGMRMLADSLTANDRVAIVVYAGSSGLVLPSTPGDQKPRIDRAIAGLEAGGSTNGGEGIRLAYKVAREHFIRGGVNRVVLATDGDFNVGTTSQDELVRLIEDERASGVFLSVLGVGTGNLKDSTMEKLADKGNGNYAYLDSLHEARKVLLREAGATLITIAKDVKIQVEFNPKAVAGYRLIGYENRMLRHEDFNDDKKDAGEIGAGHSVTALYEIVPVGVGMEGGNVDPLKYQTPSTTSSRASGDELLTVKLRYKAPDGDESKLMSTAIANRPQAMTANLGFASAVAEVGMLLRGSKSAGSASFESAATRARKFRQDDPDGYRAEFIKLAELAAGLQRLNTTAGK
jgi:Ca-activated chloride channel family protein